MTKKSTSAQVKATLKAARQAAKELRQIFKAEQQVEETITRLRESK